MVSKPADEVEEDEGRPPTARLLSFLSFLTTAATSAAAVAAVAAIAAEGEDNTFSDH